MKTLIMWNFFSVLDIFQFFLEFPFWRLGTAISIKGCLGSFKNNTGKYHGGRLQTTNDPIWKNATTKRQNVLTLAALLRDLD